VSWDLRVLPSFFLASSVYVSLNLLDVSFHDCHYLLHLGPHLQSLANFTLTFSGRCNIMYGTTAILCPPHPVTSNTIDAKQRSRLMRTTRKLGSVLGTTPQVTEPERPPIPISLHPNGPRPQHKLRRPTTTDSQGPRVFGTISEPIPNFVYSTPSMNSSIASFSVSEENRMRRPTILKSNGKRSMEIPPPLVLHLTAPTPKHHSLPQTPSTASTLTPDGRTTASSDSSPALTPLTPVFPSPTESRRKRMAKLTRTLGEKIPPQLVFATRRPSLASLKPVSSVTDTVPPLPPKAASLTAKQSSAGRRRSMSVDFVNITNTEVAAPVSRSSRVWVTSNATWWGEWNRKDIRDVQKQLRNLKAR